MGITTEEFLTRFHSLNGTTVGERRKHLFMLLNGIQRTEADEIDFSKLHPKTPLEEKFKVEALLCFKKIPDLLEVFKSENRVLIGRVLKDSSWFVEEAFQNISGEQLVTLIFPYISFSAKAKIINKFAMYLKNPQQADAFFKAIENKYGLFLVSKLLPACSPDVIKNCLMNGRVKLESTQLLIVIKKYPEVTESILKILSGKNIYMAVEYKNVFLYLAKHHINLFLKLYKEYNLSFHLGWRTTEKFVLANRQEVIKYPKDYYNLLHNRQIAKTLNRDFEHLYFNLFPKSLEDLETTYDTVVSKLAELPEKRRNVNLLLTTFQKLYGTQLWDHPKFVNVELLMMLSPDERDSKIIPEYKPKNLPKKDWICYRKTEESVPYLKQAISLTSKAYTRENLARLLVKTCHINKDLKALADVCQYMVIKHRNDSRVGNAFLNELKREIKLEDLTEQHWTSVNECINLFTLDNYSPFYNHSEFLEAYIYFRLKHNMPVKEQLTEWIKLNKYSLNILKKEPQYRKQCLLQMGELIPEIFKNKIKLDEREWRDVFGRTVYDRERDDPLNYYNCLFVTSVLEWNKQYPKDQILLFSFPNAMESIKNAIMKGDKYYIIENVIVHFLQLKTNAEEREAIINMYLTSKSFPSLSRNVIDWLVRFEPLVAIQNIESIMQKGILKEYFSRPNNLFWKVWRNYQHLEVFQKVINMCMHEFAKAKRYLDGNENRTDGANEGDEDGYDGTRLKNALAGLAYSITGEEFIQLVVPFYPSDLRANAKDEKSVKMYETQQIIGECLRYLYPPSMALESILIFSKGDYLKLIYSSLYSVFNNANQDKLPPYCEELAKRAVSIRKHALHLAFRVLNKEQVYTAINGFIANENNASVRKFIFKVVFNYFVMNPEDRFWELVKSSVNAVDFTDKEALDILMETKKIPRKFLVQHVMFTWDFLNKLPDPEKDMDDRRCTLLCLIDADVINLFPNEFCDPITENYFLKSEDGFLTYLEEEVLRFTCRYIIYCNSPAEQEKRLKSKLDILKNFALTKWNKPDVRKESRMCVKKFLKCFCWEFLNDHCRDANILVKFTEFWNGIFKPQQCFDEYLYLQLTFIYMEKLSLPQVGRKLADLCNSVVSLFGLVAIKMFYENLNSFTDHFLTGTDEVKEDNRYILTENILQASNSIACLLLVILLLNKLKQNSPETKTRYNAIVEKLEKHPEPILQVYLQSYFREEL